MDNRELKPLGIHGEITKAQAAEVYLAIRRCQVRRRRGMVCGGRTRVKWSRGRPILDCWICGRVAWEQTAMTEE